MEKGRFHTRILAGFAWLELAAAVGYGISVASYTNGILHSTYLQQQFCLLMILPVSTWVTVEPSALTVRVQSPQREETEEANHDVEAPEGNQHFAENGYELAENSAGS